jgi:hypothetical protein
MAVPIDRVYQKVLALANKEQRGYITPQEFNLFAGHAQMDIFEQYFYDLDQSRKKFSGDVEYSSPINLLEEKLYYFKKSITLTNGMNLNDISDFYMLSDVYRLAPGATYQESGGYGNDRAVVVEELNHMDLLKTQSSPLTWATIERPIYYIRRNTISFSPTYVEQNFGGYYIAKPDTPNWTYNIVEGNALYAPNINTRNFSLHTSEENNLVIKILQLAGVSIKDYQLTQVAVQEEVKNKQAKQ